MKNQKQFEFWQQWLVIANIILIVFGLLVAFAGNSVLFSLHNAKSLEVFFNGQVQEPAFLLYKKWIFGVVGGTIAGFHLLMYFIARYPFRQKEKWAYKSLVYALLLWFLVDSGNIIYNGV